MPLARKKYVPGNNKPFMNKAISKAVMLRTKLRNKPLKYQKTADRISYFKQRNFCVSLFQKVKKKIFCQSQCKKDNRQKNVLANYKAFSIKENRI